MRELLNISEISNGWRKIKDGSEYDKYFPKPIIRDRVIVKNGEVEDTIELMKKVVWKYIDDTKKIAFVLNGKTLKDTCLNIWRFLYNHILNL